MQAVNPANTSILCLKNSPNFLALCEAGEPYVITKNNMQSIGFSNFGWISSAFSAHPKVDPLNGDIYNIGMSLPNMNIMRATKNMQKICETQFKLRELQSIHDFCLAGDFIVILEAPLRFSLKQMIWGNKFFFDCLTIDPTINTLVHIYTKQDLKHVKTVEIEPFYSFHFTNGYSTKQKIVIEYVKYDVESTKQLFRLLSDVPKFNKVQILKKYPGTSTLEQLTINLEDYTAKTKGVKINGEFPVCEDHQVGKKWQYTYVIGSQSDQLFTFDTIYKYNRVTDKLHKLTLQGDVYINEPALIRTEDGLYLLCVVNRGRRSYVELYESESETMGVVCQLELPEFVPAGFHGKWEKEL